MLESIFLQLGLEFLFEPIIDFRFWGCPENCIRHDSQELKDLKEIEPFLAPIYFIIAGLIGVGAGLGIAFKKGKLKLPKFKKKEEIKVDDYAEQIIEKQKETPKQKSKKEKKEYLKNLRSVDPDVYFNQFVNSLDPEHPQTELLKTARTEAKKEEIKVPEQKVVEKISLEEQEKQVRELMKKEKISEDEAVDRIIREAMPNEMIIDAVNPDDEDEDVDVFKQDIPPKKYPKALKKLEKKFPKKEKKKFHWKLNDLGKLRRDQYAKQIESKLLRWTFPLDEYKGKNKDFQLDRDEIELRLKKLALFLSMGELMADKKRSKKRYWEKIKVAQ
ncbi:MAG: hypothetical protein GTN97_07100 [Nitrosopumilaceae archaeon]|nr:hypothetical protein [Nitrosopumilaceae archaeon]